MKSVKQFLSSSRWIWFAFGFLCAVVLISTAGSAQDAQTPAVGTYHIETAGQSVYLLDTRTGHLWLRSAMMYQDLGLPTEPIYKSSQLDR